MLIGYARTSTTDQTASIEAQQRDLRLAGAERIFVEQVSSVDMVARDQFALAMDFIREGDTLVVTKLDRLARSVAHLMQITEALDRKGAHLRILDLNIDTSTPTGKLMLTVLGGIAEFERSIMLERQREGIARAKADGKYKGRKPTAMARHEEVMGMLKAGMGPSAIVKATGISRSSVYRIMEGRAQVQ